MESILIAVDESDGGRAAIEEGLEIARETGAIVTFLTVRAPSQHVVGGPFCSYVVTTDRRPADRVIRRALDAAEEHGVQASGQVLEGDPAEEIVAFAESRRVDLIVIGSRGLGALAGTLLGSVSRAVVQHTQAPVLVAKTEARKHAAVGA
jgi:nucleotide-binding universal stress UspA family protein